MNNNNNVYPFFIECSKYYQDQPYKQRLLQQFAFGRGGSFIIKRKDKNILVTPEGEFMIPLLYSEDARLELDQKLWKYDNYEKMQEDIKNLRLTWSTTKKKDKLYLFYKYIANLELSTHEKIILCNLITLTLLLKIIRPSDIVYNNFTIQNVNQDLLTNVGIDAIEFSYDYSIPPLRAGSEA
jgi:hypothetical protein